MGQLSSKYFNTSTRKKHFAFAEYPSIKIYKSSEGSAWNNHLLFGDYIEIKKLDIVNKRVLVKSRGSKGWVKIDQINKNRVLEVNFVDIGQGDGCHIVTPNDDHILIDAGKTDNMNRYLSWRFNLYNKKRPLTFPFTTIISHSDSDHYLGFKHIFENDKIKVDKVYHNGLVERPGKYPLGKVEAGFITGLVQNTSQMKDLINDKTNRKGKSSQYCSTLFKSLKFNPDIQFNSLSVNDKYINGFSKDNLIQNKEFSIKILGPVIENANGKESLRTIKNLGKDKNGHSVLFKLIYDKASILLGGDINTEFGEILHQHYKDKNELEELKVDVAKACHHGSNHFHYGFIEAINSSATVISSGDEESYSHPRPDAIGALGKCGYGKRPLIFSTELARSTKEITLKKLKNISKLLEKLKTIDSKIKSLSASSNASVVTEKEKLRKKRIKTNKTINSFVTKYGMINVRTDGKRMIIAQKYELPASHGKWDIHELKYSDSSKRFEQYE